MGKLGVGKKRKQTQVVSINVMLSKWIVNHSNIMDYTNNFYAN